MKVEGDFLKGLELGNLRTGMDIEKCFLHSCMCIDVYVQPERAPRLYPLLFFFFIHPCLLDGKAEEMRADPNSLSRYYCQPPSNFMNGPNGRANDESALRSAKRLVECNELEGRAKRLE